MIKSYISDEYRRGAQYWDQMWRHVRIEDYEVRCSHHPLRTIFDRYLPRHGRILEGGCGPAHWVLYYSARGYQIVGVDYAEDTVRRVRRTFPSAPVYHGDVTALEFPACHFDAYYSGGVVEHFEEGPQRVLAEARRVIRRGGLLLVSVPYANILRSAIIAWHVGFLGRKSTPVSGRLDGVASTWTWAKRPHVSPPPREGFHFHEYIFTIAEFSRLLNGVGFDILSVYRFAIKYGLRDLRLFREAQERWSRILSSKRNGDLSDAISLNSARPGRIVRAPLVWWRKTIGAEQADGGLGKITVKIMRRSFANLVLFVARRR